MKTLHAGYISLLRRDCLLGFLVLLCTAFSDPRALAASAYVTTQLDAAETEALRTALTASPSLMNGSTSRLAASGAAARQHALAEAQSALGALYERRGYAPLWSHGGTPSPEAASVLRVLRAADDYGLTPEDYQPDALVRTLQSLQQRDALHAVAATPEEWAHFELLLSTALLSFVSDLHGGRIDPRAAGFQLSGDERRMDGAAVLEQLARRTDTEAVLASVEPQYIHYRLLKRALLLYRALALESDSTDLPPLPRAKVTLRQTYAGAPALRRLLVALGCLPTARAADPLQMDRPLIEALKHFQWLHGLLVDGTLGARTYAALTVPLTQRVRQIELTLERWRWLPPLQYPTVMVNIPEFRLFAFDSGQDREQGMLRMDVIVGREYPHTRTPVFMAEMREVVFRPYWDVPRSIVLREVLPQLAKDPRYLEAQHLELVLGETDASPVVPATPQNIQSLAMGTLRLRQRPGPDNALGLVKFLLPNEHDVYLHDTPAVQLFGRARRTFSHGCIRVSNPVALAEYALKQNPGNWTREKILAAMHAQATQRVPLAGPVNVMILYGTAIASEDGEVHFFDDIYGQDRRLESLLGLPPVGERSLPESHAPGVDVHEVGGRIVPDAATVQ